MTQICLRNLTIKPYQILCIIVIVIMVTLLLESILPGTGRMGLVPGLTKVWWYNVYKQRPSKSCRQRSTPPSASSPLPPTSGQPTSSPCARQTPRVGAAATSAVNCPTMSTQVWYCLLLSVFMIRYFPLQGFSTCITTLQRRTSGMQEKIGEAPGHGRRQHGVFSPFKLIQFYTFRFENLGLQDKNLILYIGGNTDGADGGYLMNSCPTW